MKKTNNKNIIKKLTTIIFCLIAIIFIVIGFIGIYIPSKGRLKNVLPEFSFGTDLHGVMEYRFKPNDTKNLTKENFKKVKNILEERFKKFGIINYNVRMDDITGNVVIELSRNNEKNWSAIFFMGKQVNLSKSLYMFDGNFRIKDYQTGDELLNNSYITNVYSEALQVSESGHQVFLQIELNKEGIKKLKDITNKYIEYVGTDGTKKIDYVDISLDDLTLAITYFPADFDRQILSIPISTELTDNKLIKEYAETANMLAEIIKIGELPITYEISSQLFIKILNSENIINISFMIMYLLLIIISIVFIINFKKIGIIAAILNAGFIALVIIILKLLEVVLLINSLISLILVVILNTMFVWIYLKTRRDEAGFLEAFKKYYTFIIPVIMISFIFTFSSNEMVAGIGNVLFWALLVQVIYNFVFTRFSIND